MTWPLFFLGCFVVGFALSVLSFALGAIDLHFHVHIPFVHHVHIPFAQHVHVPHGAIAHGHDGVGPLNFATMTAFLAWFGGTGYLLTSEFRWLAVPALLLATGVGLGGASAMFWIMARVLWSPAENMRPSDDRMIGVLARVSQAIRADGTGEVIYSRRGGRRFCSARSDDGGAIDKGSEVVVTRFERGVAYVRRWEDLANGES
jgi:hypothetical protein